MSQAALPVTDLEGLEGSEPLWGIGAAIARRGGRCRNSVPTLPTLPNPEADPGTELLNLCHSLDIRLWIDCGRLRYDAPAGVMDDTLRAKLAARKDELLALVCWEITKTDGRVRDAAPAATPPDPFAHLRGPRRTRWGSLAWSAPDEPALELFGPAPGELLS
jgi:hypothetical protein